MQKATIVIADDYPATCEIFKRVVLGLSDVDNVYKAHNGKEALSLIQRHNPRLAILDLNMPDIDGLEVLKGAREIMPNVYILIISMFSNARVVRKALQLGADGFLPKEADLEEIEKAVQEILNGKKHISPRLMPELTRLQFSNLDDLTRLEMRVLRLMAEEFTSEQIADEICACLRTVGRLKASIFEKTLTKSSLGAVLYAQKQGLFDMDC